MTERGPAPAWFPLRRQLLDSSVWEENPIVCKLWVTLLLVASEPGRRGTADMTVRALAGRACLSPEETREALDVLLSPDPRSRSKHLDGRRLEPIDPARDWGWRIVNWEQYERDRESAGAMYRMRRHRESSSRAVTDGYGPVTVNSEEKEKEKEKEKGESSATSRRPSPLSLLEAWNRERGPLPEAKGLSGTRERHARTRLGETPDLERWAAAVRRISRSPFCLGSNDRGWRATFDWLLQPDTLLKVEEGKYDPPGAVVGPEEAERRRKAEERQKQEIAIQAFASARAREFRALSEKVREREEREKRERAEREAQSARA